MRIWNSIIMLKPGLVNGYVVVGMPFSDSKLVLNMEVSMQENLKKLYDLLQVCFSIGGTKVIYYTFKKISNSRIDTLNEMVNELEEEVSFLSDLMN